MAASATKTTTKPKKADDAALANPNLLSEEEVLKMSDKDYMNEAQRAFFKHRLIAMRDDILANARETGEFCFNVVTQPVWKEMVDTANAIPEEDCEFEKTGMTPIPSVRIKPPRVKEVPIQFECKLHQIIELGPNRHPLVIGEVIYMHVDPACMTGSYIDMKKLDPIGRLNGHQYTTLGEILQRKFEDGQAR